MQLPLPWRFGRGNPFTSLPRVNWAHPLAQGLFDCLLWTGGVPPANLASPQAITTITGTPTFSLTKFGYSGYNGGGANSFDSANHGNLAAGDFSVHVIFQLISLPGSYWPLFDKGIGGSREASLFFDSAGNVNFTEIGGSSNGTAITTGLVIGGIYDVVMTRIGSTASVYVNGILASPTLSSMGGTTPQTQPLCFGRNSSGGGINPDVQYISAQVWTRGLSTAEVLQLYNDPYCFLTYPEDEMFALLVGAAPIVVSPTPALSSTRFPGLGPRSHHINLLNAALPTPTAVVTTTGSTLPMLGVG